MKMHTTSIKSKLVLLTLCTSIFTINHSNAALLLDLQLNGGPQQSGYFVVDTSTPTGSPFTETGLIDPNPLTNNIQLQISSSARSITARDRSSGQVAGRFGGLENLYQDFIRTGNGAAFDSVTNPYTTMTLSFTNLQPSQEYAFTLRLFDPGISDTNEGDYTYSITGSGDIDLLNNSYTIAFSNTNNDPEVILTPTQLAGYNENFFSNGSGALSITILQTGGAENTVPLVGLSLAAVPEPGSVALLISGAFALVGISRRRRLS